MFVILIYMCSLAHSHSDLIIFLRLFIDFNGWFSRLKSGWIYLDMQLTCGVAQRSHE